MTVNTLARVRAGYTYAGNTDLQVMTCPDCGITYAIPSVLQSNAYTRGHREVVWYCPNGHELGYNGKSEAESLQDKLDRERDHTARQAATIEQTRAALHGQKIRASRFKNDRDRERKRVAHGTCPCCGRTFKQLQRHMAGQHPEFVIQADQPREERSCTD